MTFQELDFAKHRAYLPGQQLNPGPSGEDAAFKIGQPRDVGSPIPRQARCIGRHQGSKIFYLP
jgi:hypothetical protein